VLLLLHLVAKVVSYFDFFFLIFFILLLDSTVLAHVLTLLNEKYDYGLDLFLLSIDEGITGYRDDSLEVRDPIGCFSVKTKFNLLWK